MLFFTVCSLPRNVQNTQHKTLADTYRFISNQSGSPELSESCTLNKDETKW